MRPRLLTWLVCPLCRESLALHDAERNNKPVSAADRTVLQAVSPVDPIEDVESDVTAGALTCARCHVYYPIYNGVPRMLTFRTRVANVHATEFAPWIAEHLAGFALPDEAPPPGEESVLRSFSKEWTEYDWNNKSYWDVTPDNMLRLKRYELGIPRHSLAHKLVVEIGIGIGGTADMLSRAENCELIGVDLGYAVDSARRLFGDNPRLHIVQASVFAPPIRPGAADVVYSHGVLHHTYSTENAFESVARLPNPDGGMLYVWLYSHEEKRATAVQRAAMLVEDLTRPVISRMPDFLQTVMLTPVLPFYIAYHNLVRRRRHGADHAARYGWNEALHAARDRLTPRFAHRHSYEEVSGWFKTNGYGSLEELRDEAPPEGISRGYAFNVGVRGFRSAEDAAPSDRRARGGDATGS